MSRYLHDELISQLHQVYRRINRFIKSVELAFDEFHSTLTAELAKLIILFIRHENLLTSALCKEFRVNFPIAQAGSLVL